MLVAALLLFHGRSDEAGGEQRHLFLIDAAIVILPLGVVSWLFLIEPLSTGGSGLVPALYPVTDLFLVGLLVLVGLTRAVRLPWFRLLAAGMACLIAADVLWRNVTLAGADELTDWGAAGFLLSYVLFGAAALHPSMRALADEIVNPEKGLTKRRIALQGAAILVLPVSLAIEVLLDSDLRDVVLVAAAAVTVSLLVPLRMGVMLRMVERLGGLARSAGPDRPAGSKR